MSVQSSIERTKESYLGEDWYHSFINISTTIPAIQTQGSQSNDDVTMVEQDNIGENEVITCQFLGGIEQSITR